MQVALEYRRIELVKAKRLREQEKALPQEEVNRRICERALAQKNYRRQPPEGYLRFKQLQKIGKLLDGIRSQKAS